MILQPSLFDPPARVAPLIEVLHEPDEALDSRLARVAANTRPDLADLFEFRNLRS